MKNGGTRPKWSYEDASNLIERYVMNSKITYSLLVPLTFISNYLNFNSIDAMNVTIDTDINWSRLADSYGAIWNARSLQKKWATLKGCVDGAECMSLRGSLI
jgi:hypothetical protein